MENILGIINLIFKLKDSNNVNMEDSNHETITRLKFLSKIRKGEKIDVSKQVLQTDSYFTQLSRTILSHDNRQNTLTYIQNALTSGFNLFSLYMKSEKDSEKLLAVQILRDIEASKKGIANLINTYQDDTMFCCSIETYLQTIDARMTEIYTKNPELATSPVSDD